MPFVKALQRKGGGRWNEARPEAGAEGASEHHYYQQNLCTPKRLPGLIPLGGQALLHYALQDRAKLVEVLRIWGKATSLISGSGSRSQEASRTRSLTHSSGSSEGWAQPPICRGADFSGLGATQEGSVGLTHSSRACSRRMRVRRWENWFRNCSHCPAAAWPCRFKARK